MKKSICIRRWVNASWLFFVATLFLAQSGCGPSIYLEKTPIASIAASVPNAPGIAPGEKSPLVVTITQPGGKVLQTKGKGHGNVQWKDLNVTASLVTVNQQGVITLPLDPRISDGKLAHVTVTVPSHPDVAAAELDIPVRYNYHYRLDFSGSSGSDGISGIDGIDGTNGTMGSIDPNNPSPGGNGTDGTNGTDGQNGGPGSDAPSVKIFVAYRWDNRPLLQMSVAAGNQEKFFIIDPNGGSLTVKADGGPGGRGGRGGRGGHGGTGGAGSPSGSSGRNGSDGQNGWDGSAGQGGSITVIYDPRTKPFLGTIHLSNSNGSSPVFKEQQLEPLW